MRYAFNLHDFPDSLLVKPQGARPEIVLSISYPDRYHPIMMPDWESARYLKGVELWTYSARWSGWNTVDISYTFTYAPSYLCI